MASAASSAFSPGLGGMQRSPLTVGIFMLMASYYVCFYAWVLWKSKHLKPEDLEEPRSRTLS